MSLVVAGHVSTSCFIDCRQVRAVKVDQSTFSFAEYIKILCLICRKQGSRWHDGFYTEL